MGGEDHLFVMLRARRRRDPRSSAPGGIGGLVQSAIRTSGVGPEVARDRLGDTGARELHLAVDYDVPRRGLVTRRLERGAQLGQLLDAGAQLVDVACEPHAPCHRIASIS